MKLLVVEGNPRCLIAQGRPAYARYFKATLGAIDRTLTFAVAEPFESPIQDTDLDDVDGVVFTGSSTEAATNAAQYAPQRTAMEMVFKRGIPSWGSCAGLQLAATVLGGSVGASPKGAEIGLARELTLTDTGRSHAMMTGRPTKDFAVPCIHRDEVQRLPKDAIVLAQNTHCPVQAFAYQTGGVDFWGVQYHPELAPSVIAADVRRQMGASALADLLERADRDANSAAKLGVHPMALDLPLRTTELSNWLAHVSSVKSNRIRLRPHSSASRIGT